MTFLNSIYITNFFLFFLQATILSLVLKRYAISFINGSLTFNPKVDIARIFLHISYLFLTLIFFLSILNLKTPYSYFDKGIITLTTIFNLIILGVMGWTYINENKLFNYNFQLDTEELNVSHVKSNYNNKNLLQESGFAKIINQNCVEEIFDLLLHKQILDYKGKWISEKLKRKRDIALFIGKLFHNNLLNTSNQADVCRKAKLFFEINVDTGELSTIIKFLDEDNIPTNDKESYLYLSFLDNIRI